MVKLRKKFISSSQKDSLYTMKDLMYTESRLKKALYGLKQAPRAWYEKMDGFLMSLGFNKSVVDPNLYYHIDGNECLILVLYVDDLFLTGSERLIVECK
jgi:hypothetical protein